MIVLSFVLSFGLYSAWSYPRLVWSYRPRPFAVARLLPPMLLCLGLALYLAIIKLTCFQYHIIVACT